MLIPLKKNTFIQYQTFSNHSMGAKKVQLKPVVGMIYTFYRTETKMTCYTLCHGTSPQVFCSCT